MILAQMRKAVRRNQEFLDLLVFSDEDRAATYVNAQEALVCQFANTPAKERD